MTADHLTAAPHACAAGFYPLKAGVALLIRHGTFPDRDDFTTRFIDHGTSISDGTTPMAAIGWSTAITTCITAGSPALAANGASSSCSPASPEVCPSTSATPSPASTTATPPC